MRVRIAGMVALMPEDGTKVLTTASPTGGFVMNMTTRITTIMIAPRYFTIWSTIDLADLERKITIASRAEMT